MDKEIQQPADEPHLDPPTIAELDALIDFLELKAEPSKEDGWYTIQDVMNRSPNSSYNSVIYRIKIRLRNKELERKKYGRVSYYRRRNGSE